MKTARFEIRTKILQKYFTKKNIVNIWRNVVKNQLRALDVKDLFDFYDFNYLIEERVLSIRQEVLSGGYQIDKPLIFKVEKKLGICRHLIIPQPNDALIMQIITESIVFKIKKRQPSQNAFYARDTYIFNKNKFDSDTEYGVNWLVQWKNMQKKIYKFNEGKNLLVVTDLSNYFDSIDLSMLRESILSMTKCEDQVLIDLLFRIIEEISWKPDYLPYIKHRLPTINIKAIRLLGHSFLFEVDEILGRCSGKCFVRWMDDIVVGVNSRDEAIKMLNNVSDVLKSRGLALNLSKTNLYTNSDFEFNFLTNENKYLDSLEHFKNFSGSEIIKVIIRFEAHLQNKKPKYWSKITKRFITFFSKHKVDILKQIQSLYIEEPSLRQSLSRYLIYIGYSRKTADFMLGIYQNLHIYDDVSLFYLSNVLTTWQIPDTEEGKVFLDNIYKNIKNFGDPFQFYCLLWIKSKYADPKNFLTFIKKYKNKWKQHGFLRREVVSLLARLYLYDELAVVSLLNEQVQSGIAAVVSIANLLLDFVKLDKLDKKLNAYLFPKNLNDYSLSRFLVLCAILNSSKIRESIDVKRKIKQYIKDPYFKKWLKYYKVI